jgi:arylsulfatase A-like enzyme
LPDRPNILFAIADDASHFSCYGHRFVHTPHCDALARRGLRFDAAFTTNPKCAPSRASILTGRHTWQNGEACLHWNYWPDHLPVYTDRLADAGYHVGHTGKGWGPGDWQRCGREHNPAGPAWQDRKLGPPAGSAISPRDYAGNFADFLAATGDSQPFCFWYGGHEPHRKYVPGEGQRHGVEPPTSDEVPPYWPDEPVVRQDMADYAFETQWFDTQLGRIIDHLQRTGRLHNTLVIATSDNGAPFPRVKGNMYDDDFRLPMVLRWDARLDKGGDRGGRVVDDVVSFIDFAPTFLEVAGIELPEQLPGRSLLDVIDAAPEAGAGGQDSGRRDRAVMGRERHDLGREGDLGYPVRCLRTRTHLYVRNFAPDRWPAGNPETGFTGCDSSPTKARILEHHAAGDSRWFDLAFGKRPAEQLFDIAADPHCMTNLASDPDHADLLAQLRAELEAVLRDTGDPRIAGRGDAAFEHRPYVGDAPHSWAHYLAGDWQPQSY